MDLISFSEEMNVWQFYYKLASHVNFGIDEPISVASARTVHCLWAEQLLPAATCGSRV